MRCYNKWKMEVMNVNLIKHNSNAWDEKVENGATYTKSVSKEIIEKSKAGEWEISVTTKRTVPKSWFPTSLKELKVLCLASGGGQQGPILAAAGAEVTVLDISKKQLDQDRFVAERDGLTINTVQGNMADLSYFADEYFDLIVHPVSNVFIENILPVWKEAARVLKEKGTLISGFTNPFLYVFDDEQEDNGILEVKHSIPCSSVSHLTEEELEEYLGTNQTIEFGHTLEDQMQGQIDAGFVIAGFYEDNFGGNRMLDDYISTFIATKAVKVRV